MGRAGHRKKNEVPSCILYNEPGAYRRCEPGFSWSGSADTSRGYQDFMRTIDEIRTGLKRGSAVIVTASELKERVARGDDISDVDVVTCGTCGVMSGTYVVMSVPVAPPGTFYKADTITLQGVPAMPGPCPNERLGLVDLMVFGTAHADDRYGGGHLFRDLIAGKEIHVQVTAEGRQYDTDVTLGDLPFARLFSTRSAYKNYSAITNQGRDAVRTIFLPFRLKVPRRRPRFQGVER